MNPNKKIDYLFSILALIVAIAIIPLIIVQLQTPTESLIAVLFAGFVAFFVVMAIVLFRLEEEVNDKRNN